MATINRPTFPDPALEVGIAQYPTPNVPDYYTRDGHIILVEKVSIEKGNYNPQPLDGSVIYSKRDANDWPSTLYLVFQQTEPTGKFVFNYWANDRTLASQDPWNYGLQYSLNHPDFKIITRVYITPREDYAPVALGSTDPVFGGTAIISKQEMAELPDDNPLRSRYVQVQRVYETIPSSIITGKRVTERGDIETLDTQVVVAGTAPDADGLLVTQTAIESIDAVKSKRTKGSVTSYSTLTTKAKRAGLLGEVSVSDDIVAPATNPDALTTSIIDSTVEAISATKSRKRTTTSSGPSSLTAKKISERGDTQTITKSIVASNVGVTTDSLLLVASQVDEIDSAKSQKTDVTVTSYASLTTKSKKAGLLGEVSISDEIVSPATNPDALSTTVLDSTVEAISATKSRKRTTTATGPSSLSGVAKKEGLLGEVSLVESIVAAGSSADALSTTILSSEVTPIDSAKSKKTTVTSTGPSSLEGATQRAGLLGVTEEVQSIVASGSAPDTLSTTILQSSVVPIDSAKSKKTTVTSIGPTTLGGLANKGGLLGEVQTTESIVAYGEAADALSTTILQSSVDPIDAYKSKKTTVEAIGPTALDGASKKGGLLGEVDTIEEIVAYGTEPTELSTTVLQSEVTPIDSYKSKRTTITASGPTSLDGVGNKAGLLGETETTESIVAYGANADALSTTILQSEVTPIDEYKSKKVTVTSTGPSSLSGETSKAGLLGNVTTAESIVAAGSNADAVSLTIIQSEVTPIDSAKSKKTTVTASGPTSLVGYQYDEFFEQKLTITQSIVAPNAAAPAFGNGLLSYRDEPIDSAKSKRIVVSTPSLPPSRTEYKTGTYTSPLLVFDIEAQNIDFSCDGNDPRIQLTPITRGSQTGPTTFKTVTSYSYGVVTPPQDNDIFSPILKEVSFTGYVVNFNLGAALCDHIYAPSISGLGQGILIQSCGDIPPFTYKFEYWDIAESSPYTATEYLGFIGDYKKISWESRYWKAGIWESKSVYVKLI
jgi:hypothetical protein